MTDAQIDDLIRIHSAPLRWNNRDDLTFFKRQVIEETVMCLNELKQLRKSSSIPVEGVCR